MASKAKHIYRNQINDQPRNRQKKSQDNQIYMTQSTRNPIFRSDDSRTIIPTPTLHQDPFGIAACQHRDNGERDADYIRASNFPPLRRRVDVIGSMRWKSHYQLLQIPFQLAVTRLTTSKDLLLLNVSVGCYRPWNDVGCPRIQEY